MPPLACSSALHAAARTSNESARARRAKRRRDLYRLTCQGVDVETGNKLKHGDAGQGMRGPVIER